MYKTVNQHYKEKYGCKIYKLSLDGGFTCPNRDGTLSTKGCIFCSAQGSGDFAQRGNDIKAQLEQAKKWVENKNKFILSVETLLHLVVQNQLVYWQHNILM